jgi:hypothetical protein
MPGRLTSDESRFKKRMSAVHKRQEHEPGGYDGGAVLPVSSSATNAAARIGGATAAVLNLLWR